MCKNGTVVPAAPNPQIPMQRQRNSNFNPSEPQPTPMPPALSSSILHSPRSLPKPSSRGVILFDLDDTLICSTPVTPQRPVIMTFTGYGTVVHVGGVDHFVAIRPFALSSLTLLHEAGFKVGFWSAGSPPYVSQIVARLIAGIRYMQTLRKRTQTQDRFVAFTPVAVISLDHASGCWYRDVTLESGGGGGAGAAQYKCLSRKAFLPGTPIIKYMKDVARHHENLATALAEQNIVLIDNLAHDPTFTIHFKAFVPSQHNHQDKSLLLLTKHLIAQE
jgi:hypothetical protein